MVGRRPAGIDGLPHQQEHLSHGEAGSDHVAGFVPRHPRHLPLWTLSGVTAGRGLRRLHPRSDLVHVTIEPGKFAFALTIDGKDIDAAIGLLALVPPKRSVR